MTRRQLARHASWFGSAVVLSVTGGEVVSRIADARDAASVAAASTATGDPGTLRFVQISDSHIGFAGPANTDVTGSFARAIDQVNTLGFRPAFVMHTGDLTHLSTPAQFDQVKQMMSGLDTDRVFTVPGEHDSVDDHGRAYRQTFARGTEGDGWYSFDTHGVHFIALVNTLSLEKLGHLGADQIDFVRRDVAGLPADTPIVVFSHIPLFAMYPKWGWATDDSLQVLNLLKSPRSTGTSTNCSHASKATSPSTRPPRPPTRCPSPARLRRRPRRCCRPGNCTPRSAFAASNTDGAPPRWRSPTRS
jgi:Icc protein